MYSFKGINGSIYLLRIGKNIKFAVATVRMTVLFIYQI